MLFVNAHLALAALFFLFNLRHTATQWANGRIDAFVVANNVIRALSVTLLAVLLWRYAAAVKRFNTEDDPDAARLESAHAALWRWGAILLAVNFLQMVLVLSRPAIRPHAGEEQPATQTQTP